MKKEKNKSLQQKILEKYRVVIVNEQTFEEKFSLKLSLFRLLIFSSLFAFFLIVTTTLLIIYTPLRQYILGFSEVEFKHQIVQLNFKTDSLETALKNDKIFLESVQKVIRGDLQPEEFHRDSVLIENTRNNLANLDIQPSPEELKLRQEVAEEDKYSVFDPATSVRKKVVFFSPISGVITSSFSPENKRFGVKISASEGTPVKAVADGSVIFSAWSLQMGNVIILEHSENFISVYKNNHSLVKKQGDLVKAGEIIANIGSSKPDENPYLQFELWNNGYAIDPFNYINFK